MNQKAINIFEDISLKASISRQVWEKPSHFLAFGFGTGLLPFIPGTFGTLIAIPFYLLMQGLPWQIYFASVMVAFIFGIWLCEVTEKAIGVEDFRGIVFDEMVGYWFTMFLAPKGWLWIVLGFFLFRFFDVVKPWPISWFNDHVHGGFGIMLDDMLAAIPSFILLQVIYYSLSLI